MLTSKMVKKAAREIGADLCGIASMDRFEGAPKQQDPRYIFPDAKACIVLGFRIPRGYFRGIEEGTYFAAYTGMGYGGLNYIYMPIVLRELCCFIEDNSFEASPIPNTYPGASIPSIIPENAPKEKHDSKVSRPVRPDLPNPDIKVDFRVLAFAAGLGEYGWSKVFLTPEFGPRQRFVAILTDAPLEQDPIFTGKICDRCMMCAAQCPGNAISRTESESLTIEGHTTEWGKLDIVKCGTAYMGGKAEYNPFMRPWANEKKWENKGVHCPELKEVVGYEGQFDHEPSIGAARGCMRACFIHLEERGILKNKIITKFRKRKPWKLAPLGSAGWDFPQPE